VAVNVLYFRNFNRDWVFRNVNYQFEIPGTYVIKGPNGSGKSTLLKILSGFLIPTEGELKLLINSNHIATENWSNHITYAAPYYELIEEMYLEEFVSFYIKFKPLQKGISLHDLIKVAYLEEAKDKQIKNFSSGMKQRLKLAIAWLSDTAIVLLDEPCSNLDAKGVDWYKSLATKYAENRLVIVCSNNLNDEFSFCKKSLDIENFTQNSNS
jgi:ABC-type multidrug transport system ATPase subunit